MDAAVDPVAPDDEVDADDADFEDSSDAEEDAADPDPDPDAVGDDSSAHATPGTEAIAPPTPSAIARAPTRPMYLEYAVGLEDADRDPRGVAVAAGPFTRFRPGKPVAAAAGCPV